MKRSQMLKIITKICKSWENCEVTIKMAEEILTEIEKVGMIPPKRIISQEKWIKSDGVKFRQGRMWHRSWKIEK